jgi:hypothetical protein
MKTDRSASPALVHLRRHVVAYLALFFAIGGAGAYAAGALPKNSVGAKQLKRNAVTSKKVKDGTLRAADFASGQLQAGPRGQVGPQGDRGPIGEQGPQGKEGPEGKEGKQGASGFSVLSGPPPSGTTMAGYFGDQMPLATGKKFTMGISFPIPLASGQPAAVVFAPGVSGATTDATCEGNHNAPTAPPGKVCVYSKGSSGAGTPDISNVSQVGFGIGVPASGGNPDFVGFNGVWAYTAP